MKGHYTRVVQRRLKGAMRIIIWYRRLFVEDWFNEVLTRFQDCDSMPDHGKSVEWPEPPTALKVSQSSLRMNCLPRELFHHVKTIV